MKTKKLLVTFIVIMTVILLGALLVACDKEDGAIDTPLNEEEQAQVDSLVETFVNAGLLPSSSASVYKLNDNIGFVNITLKGDYKPDTQSYNYYTYSTAICINEEKAISYVEDGTETFYRREGRIVFSCKNLGILNNLQAQSMPAGQPFNADQIETVKEGVREAITALFLNKKAVVNLRNTYSELMGGFYKSAEFSSSVVKTGNIGVYGWANYSTEKYGIDAASKTAQDIQKSIDDGNYSQDSFVTSEQGVYNARYEDLPGFHFKVYPVSVAVTGYCAESLTDIVIPAEFRGLPVKSIAEGAFLGNTLINSITIPQTVTTIEAQAFNTCSELLKVYIPTSVKKIEESVFYYSPKLTIYCSASDKPSLWSSDWNCSRPVVWGYEG